MIVFAVSAKKSCLDVVMRLVGSLLAWKLITYEYVAWLTNKA